MGLLRVGHDFTFTFHFHALEKEMAPHSSVLAWRIPGMGEPGGLPSMGSHRVGHDWSDLAAAAQCILQFSYYILQFCDFHFLLSYIFDLFVEILCVLPFFSPVWWVSFEPILWTLCQVNYSLHFSMVLSCWGFPGGSAGKESACNAGDLDSILWSGRSPREGNGNPLQYSCLDNTMDRRA